MCVPYFILIQKCTAQKKDNIIEYFLLVFDLRKKKTLRVSQSFHNKSKVPAIELTRP